MPMRIGDARPSFEGATEWLNELQETADDYVVATGESHTVQEFVQEAFAYVGLDWKQHVEIDPHYYRPAEVNHLLGDISKARKVLGWAPALRAMPRETSSRSTRLPITSAVTCASSRTGRSLVPAQMAAT